MVHSMFFLRRLGSGILVCFHYACSWLGFFFFGFFWSETENQKGHKTDKKNKNKKTVCFFKRPGACLTSLFTQFLVTLALFSIRN